MPFSYLFSREFLRSKPMLRALFWINVAGTFYGYVWYGDQLADTAEQRPLWLLPFVPDSPTASLLFTVCLGMMLFGERYGERPLSTFFGGLVGAAGTVASFKYGIWAVAMIAAGGLQGDILVWQDWMLVVSHAGMALEAVLYAGFLSMRPIHFLLAAVWLFANDWLDYHAGIFPYLPKQLLDDLAAIERFTISLTALSLAVIAAAFRRSKIGHPPI